MGIGYNLAWMQVTFWGVRGSHPVPGPNTVRYGGQTSCVELVSAAGHRIILDAGTGLRELGRKLAKEQLGGGASEHHILLSHVHWDHIQGLPFFEPSYIQGSKISVYALRTAADELQQVIGGITRHEYFPTHLELVPAAFEFHEVVPKRTMHIHDFQVTPLALNHPFGAVGYHITADDTSIAYVSDTAPFTDVLHKQHFLSGPEELTEADRSALRELERDLTQALRGTDTVIYDTHFLPDEYARFPHYGHSTPEHALSICTGIGVRRLVLYHHAPSHTDEIMDGVAKTYGERGAAAGLEVVVAREHVTLPIGVGEGA